MHGREKQGRSWLWLVGGLCFASAWLSGALEASLSQAWNAYTLLFLALTSLFWGLHGWQRARSDDDTREGRAFSFAIFALAPWFLFLVLMIAPYAFGVRQWPR